MRGVTLRKLTLNTGLKFALLRMRIYRIIGLRPFVLIIGELNRHFLHIKQVVYKYNDGNMKKHVHWSLHTSISNTTSDSPNVWVESVGRPASFENIPLKVKAGPRLYPFGSHSPKWDIYLRPRRIVWHGAQLTFNRGPCCYGARPRVAMLPVSRDCGWQSRLFVDGQMPFQCPSELKSARQ